MRAQPTLLTAFSLLDKIRSNPDWVAIRAKGRDMASLQVTHNEHLALIDAIEARHAEAARTAMRDHLETRFNALSGELENAAAEQGEAFFAVAPET